jgi:hypothetical protein
LAILTLLAMIEAMTRLVIAIAAPVTYPPALQLG